MEPRVSVVVATRNRRDELLGTLRRLSEPGVPVIVVDNGSTDGTAQAVRDTFPDVQVLALPDNLGARGRNVGAQAARTPYVAFSDDDSWWAPGALQRAADVLDAHPRLAVLAARPLVGAQEREDPMAAALAASPLGRPPGAPGPSVLGFLACAAVVRRDAFLAVDGFNELIFHIGEEMVLAIDLAARGWELAYVDDVVAHHHPSSTRSDPAARRRQELRNGLLMALLRRPWSVSLPRTLRLAMASFRDPVARSALVSVLRLLPAVLRARTPPPMGVENQLRLLERSPA
jgi:GT2 family glycosyltransferase